MEIENIHNIVVEVETNYVEGQSEPDDERYVFSYMATSRKSRVKVLLANSHTSTRAKVFNIPVVR